MGIRLLVLLMFSTILTGCWPFDSDDSSSPTPVTYTAEFSEPSQPNIYPCDGTITFPKIISVCKKNSGQVVDNINCSHLPIPQSIFKSPTGEQIDPLINDSIEIIGDRTFTCEEGKNRANSQVFVSCTDERYKLKGEANQRESFCKHFPIDLILGTSITCIKFSDIKYECTGLGINSILNTEYLSPDYIYWEREETSYLRAVDFFKGVDSLTFSYGGSFPLGIKNNKTYGKEVVGEPMGMGNSNIEALIVKVGTKGNSQAQNLIKSFLCYVGLDNKLVCKGDGASFGMNYNSSSFIEVPNISNVDKLYVGNNTCIKTLDGTVKCAGNSRPILGLGPSVLGESIVEFAEVSQFYNAENIILTWSNTCAIMPTNKVLCSGAEAQSDVPIELTDFQGSTSLAIGFDNFCSIIGPKVYCSKYHNSVNSDISFREIEKFRNAKIISSSVESLNYSPQVLESTFCAIMENDNVLCTGSNSLGQLGTHDLLPRYDDPAVLWEF